jgi:hypothetical protein
MTDIRGKNFNDKASYVEVPNGAGAVIFTDGNYGGSACVLLPGKYNLESASYSAWNNTISSVKVMSENEARNWKQAIVVTPSPTPTPPPIPQEIEPNILQAQPKQNTVNPGDSVMIYVKTNDIVGKIELINERGEVVAGSSVPTSSRSGEKEWDFAWKTQDVGKRSLIVRAYAGAKYTDKNISVTVALPDVPKPAVIGVSYPSPIVDAGETVIVNVNTNLSTSKVCLMNERREIVAEAVTSASTSGNQKVWQLPWGTSMSGERQISVYAGDESGYQTERGSFVSLSITVKEPVASLKIYSVAVANSTVTVGDYCWMTVVTSADISDMWVVNESGGDTVYQLVSTYSVGNNKGWDIGWQLGKAGNRTGYIIASNGSQTVSMPFNCTAIN